MLYRYIYSFEEQAVMLNDKILKYNNDITTMLKLDVSSSVNKSNFVDYEGGGRNFFKNPDSPLLSSLFYPDDIKCKNIYEDKNKSTYERVFDSIGGTVNFKISENNNYKQQHKNIITQKLIFNKGLLNTEILNLKKKLTIDNNIDIKKYINQKNEEFKDAILSKQYQIYYKNVINKHLYDFNNYLELDYNILTLKNSKLYEEIDIY